MGYENDHEIIKQCKKGNGSAFRSIVEKYQEKIIWAAYQLIGNHEEARDISQEAFIRAYRALEQFNPESNFYTWLYRIVINLCIDFLRKQKHARWLTPEDTVELK